MLVSLVRLVVVVVGLVLAYGVRRTPTLTILAAAPAPELWCITHPRPHPRLLRLGCPRCYHLDRVDCHHQLAVESS